MNEFTKQHKQAWEFDAYEFWVKQAGTPEERAREDRADPKKMLRKYAQYFDRFEGVRVANICGSCGKKAIPLALLGADVTIFDISEQNRRYAMETAQAANVSIAYEVGDVMETDLSKFGGYFDVVFMEGGILHYFFDISAFMMRCKLEEAKSLLMYSQQSITEISNYLCFSSQSYFTSVFRKKYGLTPKEYRLQHGREFMP